jgi:23S rRNA (guanosine2251-2'-O)-methyltransferase
MDLICGINPVLEALHAATRHFDRLLVVKGMRNPRLAEIVSRGSQQGIPLRFESRETLDRMAGPVPHQGIIAVVSQKPLERLEEITGSLKDPGLLVLLDGVEDPRNLGAILRTCEGAGVQGVLLPERRSAGLSETVARSSAGALEHLRIARIGNVVQAIESLKARGLWIVGFDAEGGERWDQVDLTKGVALVFGGEARGIRRLVREKCDHLVSLPLFGHVSSLNVSVAAGIALYEVVRQRRLVPSIVRPIPAQAPRGPRISGPSPEDLDSAESGSGSLELEDDDLSPEVVRIDDAEEAAWAVKAPPPAESQARVEHRRAISAGGGGGREQRPRGRRRKGGRRGGGRGLPPGAPAPPMEAAPTSQPEGGASPGAAHGRRRRRRRRRRPPPAA